MTVSLIVIAILVLVLILPVRLEAFYENDEIAKKASVFIKYGFIKYQLYPEKQSKKKAEKDEKEEKEDENDEKEPFSFEKKKQEIEKYIRIFEAVKSDAVKILNYAARHAVVFDNIEVKSEFGFDDAMQTGIFTGIYNGFVYGIMGIIHHTSKLRAFDVKLQPEFGKKCFYNRFSCILHIKTVHIIIIAFKVLKIMRKVKKEGRK